MKARLALTLFAALVTLHGCVSNPQREPSVSGGVTVETDRARVSVVFTNDDRAAIHDYYSHGKTQKHKKMPPGLAKREQLPPGLQKQIQRNGALPPGLEGRALPDDLERRLSRLPSGYIRLRIDTDLVILNEKTRIVMDVIHDIS